MKQICESCGGVIEKPEEAFRMKIEIFADPTPPEFTQEDLERDYEAEMRALFEQMENMDPKEVEDEVHEAYLFTLCAACRLSAHRELKRRQLPFDQNFKPSEGR
jgi:hypothetical protein